MGCSKESFMHYREAFCSPRIFRKKKTGGESKLIPMKKKVEKAKSKNTNAEVLYVKPDYSGKIYLPAWEESYKKHIEEGAVYFIKGEYYCLKSLVIYNINGVCTNNGKSRYALADGPDGEVLISEDDLQYKYLLGASCDISKRAYTSKKKFV